ncbi:hypothetical protein J6590_041755 [Homalodisca vitripennis]|nr:hypothetical protein J6590_041755 [Homalodisca vitripennis]
MENSTENSAPAQSSSGDCVIEEDPQQLEEKKKALAASPFLFKFRQNTRFLQERL